MAEVFRYDPPPPFDRTAPQGAARIGDGAIGGKAAGLMSARSLLADHFDAARFPDVDVDVPRFTVVTTDVYDAFMDASGLAQTIDPGWTDDRIAHAFQQHDLPFSFVGDLRALVERTQTPIAARSSSLLEDRLAHPFAGVYETKMIPNNQADPDVRFQKLIEAIKLVYAAMHFRGARNYLHSVGKTPADEKMAVVLQEVVGLRHDARFYPHVSAVAKSFNYYAFGRARPEDGVVNLALGLGKTIVDGGVSWSYCPSYPKIPPPFASPRDQLRSTQTRFWAVNMGEPPAFDPISETEYLEHHELADADYDGILGKVASSYDGAADRLLPGVRRGMPHVVNFAPVLEYDEFPLNGLIAALLESCESAFGSDVEIELAVNFSVPIEPRARLGFLQVRPMAGKGERVDIPDDPGGRAVVSSDRVLGNGVVEGIRDVVYVRPESFELAQSRAVAAEIEAVNQRLLDEGRPYLLIGFGRWGSSDPWLGIPVEWSQICAAQVVVEATIEGVRVDPSQGSHFFHNLSSFRVSYFTVGENHGSIDWGWLDALPAQSESGLLRHVRLETPITVMVDGRTARGTIFRTEGA